MFANKGKTWVIDVDKSLPDDDLARAQLEKLANAARERLSETGAQQAYVQVGPVPDRTGLLIVAAYALGPLAPVFLRQGGARTNILLACLGLAALPLWAGLILRWGDVSGWAASGQLPFLAWSGGVVALTAATFLTWGRAVFLAGWDARFFPERLPVWVSNPVVALLSGLTTPGFGLLLHNAPRRAAWAVWNAGITTIAALTLLQMRLLWQSNAASTSAQLEPRTLEYVFLGALAIVVVGALVWVGSALDGARSAMHRSGHRMQGRGEWLVFGVLAAMVAFAATFRPEVPAREFDRASARMQSAGMSILPTLGAALATDLDPAQPTYALRLAELHDSLGNTERAASIRADLDMRWTAYQKALESETIATNGVEGDPWIPFALPSVSLSGAHLSEFRAWSETLRESVHTKSTLMVGRGEPPAESAGDPPEEAPAESAP